MSRVWFHAASQSPSPTGSRVNSGKRHRCPKTNCHSRPRLKSQAWASLFNPASRKRQQKRRPAMSSKRWRLPPPIKRRRQKMSSKSRSRTPAELRHQTRPARRLNPRRMRRRLHEPWSQPAIAGERESKRSSQRERLTLGQFLKCGRQPRSAAALRTPGIARRTKNRLIRPGSSSRRLSETCLRRRGPGGSQCSSPKSSGRNRRRTKSH